MTKELSQAIWLIQLCTRTCTDGTENSLSRMFSKYANIAATIVMSATPYYC
jgi:hypothetical protein